MLTIISISKLVIGNLDTFRAHLTGLRLLINLRGGLHALGVGGILHQLALR